MAESLQGAGFDEQPDHGFRDSPARHSPAQVPQIGISPILRALALDLHRAAHPHVLDRPQTEHDAAVTHGEVREAAVDIGGLHLQPAAATFRDVLGDV